MHLVKRLAWIWFEKRFYIIIKICIVDSQMVKGTVPFQGFTWLNLSYQLFHIHVHLERLVSLSTKCGSASLCNCLSPFLVGSQMSFEFTVRVSKVYQYDMSNEYFS